MKFINVASYVLCPSTKVSTISSALRFTLPLSFGNRCGPLVRRGTRRIYFPLSFQWSQVHSPNESSSVKVPSGQSVLDHGTFYMLDRSLLWFLYINFSLRDHGSKDSGESDDVQKGDRCVSDFGWLCIRTLCRMSIVGKFVPLSFLI